MPDIIGAVVNLVVSLKILESLLNRDFKGIAGKAIAFYAKTEVDLIGVTARLFHSPWLKAFLTVNLDLLIITALLLALSLRSALSLIKKLGAGNTNSNKIIDTVTIAFFVTFGACAASLLSIARGCYGSNGCDIVEHGFIATGITASDLKSLGIWFVLSNILIVPLFLFIRKVKTDWRAILISYASIFSQLFVFLALASFALIVGSFS